MSLVLIRARPCLMWKRIRQVSCVLEFTDQWGRQGKTHNYKCLEIPKEGMFSVVYWQQRGRSKYLCWWGSQKCIIEKVTAPDAHTNESGKIAADSGGLQCHATQGIGTWRNWSTWGSAILTFAFKKAHSATSLVATAVIQARCDALRQGKRRNKLERHLEQKVGILHL